MGGRKYAGYIHDVDGANLFPLVKDYIQKKNIYICKQLLVVNKRHPNTAWKKWDKIDFPLKRNNRIKCNEILTTSKTNLSDECLQLCNEMVSTDNKD